jgi:hypothetical protein
VCGRCPMGRPASIARARLACQSRSSGRSSSGASAPGGRRPCRLCRETFAR